MVNMNLIQSPVIIAIDLERHLYSQYSFLYEIGGLINHYYVCSSN